METVFFEKAKVNFEAARICFENGLYDPCANRAYYAAFQAAISALINKGIKREKFDHKWVQAEFSEKLIKIQKVYPSKLKSYLIEMQLIRNRADYEGHHVNRRNASEQMSRAEEMLMYIGKEIGR